MMVGGAMKVAVFGLGYVGSVTAACLAANGHDVWGVDVDTAKVDPITQGRSPVVEPGLEELIAKAVAVGSLHATTDPREALDGADVSLVCVGTPSSPSGGTCAGAPRACAPGWPTGRGCWRSDATKPAPGWRG